MNNVSKVSGVSTQEIIDFLNSNSIPHKVEPCRQVVVNHRDGYPNTRNTYAFKSTIALHPANRNRVMATFPKTEYNHHYDYRALFKAEFLEGKSGLVEMIDGMIAVDTVLSGTVNEPQYGTPAL